MTLIDWDGLKARGILLSKAAIYRNMEAGFFPKQVKQGRRRIAWIAEEVDAWIADRAAKRDKAAA